MEDNKQIIKHLIEHYVDARVIFDRVARSESSTDEEYHEAIKYCGKIRGQIDNMLEEL